MRNVIVTTTSEIGIGVHLPFDTARDFELRQHGNMVITCARNDAAELIGAIAKVAGVTIDQIAAAMGAQLPVTATTDNEQQRLHNENEELWEALEKLTRSRNKELLDARRKRKELEAKVKVATPVWVPTSERLPDKDGLYLTQWRWEAMYVLRYDDEYVDTHPNSPWRDGDIVAWQPLPPRYAAKG